MNADSTQQSAASFHYDTMASERTGQDLYIADLPTAKGDFSLFAGWTAKNGVRVDPHVCTSWCIHDPIAFRDPYDFGQRGLSLAEFVEFADAIADLRGRLTAGIELKAG